MSVQKILYENKETFQVSPLEEIQKATAANYNEIKDVVNFNADDLDNRPGNVQNSDNTFDVDTGVADAYDITLTPAITVYIKGQLFSFEAINANLTTTPTADVNAVGAKTITNRDGSSLSPGDIPANSLNIIQYDGTNFQLLSPTNDDALINGFVDVEYGSASDQAATVQAAIDAASNGDVLRFKKGVVKIETALNIDKEITIVGRIETVFETSSNITIFSFNSDNINLQDLVTKGDAGSQGSGAKTLQLGIDVNGFERFSIMNIKGFNLNGGLFKSQNLGGVTRDGGSLSGCFAVDCLIAYDLFTSSEYINLFNCNSFNSLTGIRIRGGNNQIIGGIISSSLNTGTGILLFPGSNNAHGQVVGTTIKHMTLNIDAQGITGTLGMVFSGCSMFAGDLKFTDSDGINLTGCAIDADIITVDNSTIMMSNNYMRDTPIETILNGGSIVKNHNRKSDLTEWFNTEAQSIFKQTPLISISSAELLAINTTPIVLVAAAGAGTRIVVSNVSSTFTFVTAAYTGDTQLKIQYAGSSSFLTGINTNSGVDRFANHGGLYYNAPTDEFDNKDIVVTTGASDPLTGSGTITYVVEYSIVTI